MSQMQERNRSTGSKRCSGSYKRQIVHDRFPVCPAHWQPILFIPAQLQHIGPTGAVSQPVIKNAGGPALRSKQALTTTRSVARASRGSCIAPSAPRKTRTNSP